MVENLKEAIILLFIGGGVVFLSLFLLQLLIYLIHFFESGRVEEEIGGDGDEVVSVITAACHEVLGKKVKICRIKLADEFEMGDWTYSGRYDVLHSHNIKKE